MRIDSHHHLWALARGDYRWMSPDLGPIYRDFAPSDLAPHLEQTGITSTILVQAADTVSETEFLLGLADATDWIAGVVGWVDMEAPDAIAQLARLASTPKFKGIRPMIQDIAEDDWILRRDLDPVFTALSEMGLSFDALVLPHHLPHLLRRLDRHPDLRCVVNHGAKPDLTSGDLSTWSADLNRLAKETGSYCKLSGLVTQAAAGYTLDTIRPAADHIIQAFGPARVMFGSDWPVLNLNGDYDSWVSITAELITSLGAQEKQNIWSGSASVFYRL